MTVSFRPHHFLCALGFQGKGYSPGFVRNFARLVSALRDPRSGDDVEIEVVAQTDDVCAPCPHRRGELCATQEKIEALDRAHQVSLKIQPGDRLTWRAAKNKIATHISLADFDRICAPCEWQKLGICRAALEKLIQEHLHETPDKPLHKDSHAQKEDHG